MKSEFKLRNRVQSVFDNLTYLLSITTRIYHPYDFILIRYPENQCTAKRIRKCTYAFTPALRLPFLKGKFLPYSVASPIKSIISIMSSTFCYLLYYTTFLVTSTLNIFIVSYHLHSTKIKCLLIWLFIRMCGIDNRSKAV